MAVAYLHNTTRDGDAYGADRLESTEVFVSQTDTVTGDPISPVEALRPIGRTHELDRFAGLVVQRYVQRRTSNPLVWFVDVIYDFPNRPGFAGWTTEMSYGEQTEKVIVDLDQTIVGAHKYDPIPEPEGPMINAYFVETPAGRVYLRRADGPLNRTREGMDIFVGAPTIVLSRTLRHMTAEIMREVQTYQHTYNSDRFLAWRPGELLFRNGIIREEVGPPDPLQPIGDRTPSLVYPVELHLAVKLPNDDEPEGWRTIRRVEFFRDSQGNELVVRQQLESGETRVAWKEFWRYRPSVFADIISIIEGGDAGETARIGSGGKP